MLIPIGADIAYEGGELRISAKAAGFDLQLIPSEKKDNAKPPKEKRPRKKKEDEKSGEETGKKLNLDFSFDEIIELLKKVLKGFGILGKKFRVERFKLDYLAAGSDPYSTARIFGCVNAGLNILAPICAQRFDVDELYVRTDIDFTTEKTLLDFGIALTIRIGAIFRVVFTILFGALGVLIKHKLLKLKTKCLNKTGGGNEENRQIPGNNINDSNIEQGERNDKNGE